MFSKPEEVIMAVLAGLWVILTYFLSSYAGMPTHTALLITLFTLIWAIVFFLMWQRSQTRFIWPIFLGLLVACWWPAITWFAYKDVILPGTDMSTIILSLPWYATWTAKFIYAFIPVVVGYIIKWRWHQRRQTPAQP
ncbi:hypothetical protein [Snodgrassella sp. CFCC 13594]|uniref:hypothetical protein n=1 Tax=Snodgrassella sp. CFCC 13594 TaxID=1775559 RepID=UPI0008321C38|nr:hypothetical protein [Snodgrassella sp. CFCC 13594]